MVSVRFYGLLRLLLKREGVDIPRVDGDTVGNILRRAEDTAGVSFLHKLLSGEIIQTGTIILVNGHNIHHLDLLETAIADGDTVALFPPGAGG